MKHFFSPPIGLISFVFLFLLSWGESPCGALAAGLTPSWQSIGPLNMPSFEPSQGRVNAVAFDPVNSKRFFVGAATGGIWRTTDGGSTYMPLTDKMPTLAVSSLVVDSSNPNHIYVATGDADGGAGSSIGVWHSLDGGTTWSATGLNFPNTDYVQIYKLIQHPNQPATLFAATTKGLYTTTNNGTTWKQSLATYTIFDLKFKPGTPATLYACGRDSGGGRFLRSLNSGSTWSVIPTGLPDSTGVGRCALATTAAAPATVYFLNSGSSNYYGLWRSQDSGSSFVKMSGDPDVFWSMSYYTCTIAAAPDAANEVYVGGISPYKSTDGGKTWTDIRTDKDYAMTCHVDCHALEWQGKTLFIGTDGGVHRTANRGVNWTDLSARLCIAQIYGFSQGVSDPSLIYSSEQDNGLELWNGSTWSHMLVGDYGGSVIDPIQPTTVYAFAQSSLYKTTDGWITSQPLTISTTESGPFIDTALAIDPFVHTTLYAALQNVWKSTNSGTTWSRLSNFGSDTVSSITVAPSNSAYIYATTYAGNLWVTQTGGKTWTNTRANGLATSERAIQKVAVSPLSPTKAYVTTDGYASGPRVYQTTNAGGLWTDFSGSLPSVPVRSITTADGSRAGVYIGTNLGVYYRNSTMNDWIAFNAGFPNVSISDLQIHKGSQKLRASTYGRGMWQSSMVETPPIVETGGVSSLGPAVAEGCNSLTNVTAVTSPGYTVVNTGIFKSAPACFRLAQPLSVDQTITLNPLYVPSATSKLQFYSRLCLATPAQTIHVQVSTDGATTWKDLYTQNGDDTPGETAFIARSISLAAYANKAILIRFSYTASGGYYAQTISEIWWYFDSISFSNTSQIVPSSPSATKVNGTVNPQGKTATAWFQYGLTTAYGSQSTAQSIPAGTSSTPVTSTIGNLLPNTTYHYRLVSKNEDGTSYGQDFSFKTAAK